MQQNTTNAAIWYQPDGYSTSNKKIMGRHAAGEAFLRAVIQDDAFPEIMACAPDIKDYEHFKTLAAHLGMDKPHHHVFPGDHRRLAEVGTLYFPSPGINDLAWRRRRDDQRGYSICGVFYTICSKPVMDDIAEFLVAPLQSWDAVICSSDAMKSMVVRLLEEQGDYLEERFGRRVKPALQLPVIPFGVHCSLYNNEEKNFKARKLLREELKIDEEDICVLFLGRLSYHAKGNPLPMYIGLERAQRATGKKIHLVQAGRFSHPSAERIFRKSAAQFAPSVTHHFFDGTRPETDYIWAAADIFTSLSDNLQESFGLTPVEAMAAGLPVVVTDWDGYRETVSNGTVGFTIPTAQPAAECGVSLARAFEDNAMTYDQYIGICSQLTAVNLEAATRAYSALIENQDLREKMGLAGRERARTMFDWPLVLARYRELWGELAARRNHNPEIAARKQGRSANPKRMDPFELFAAYPTTPVDLSSRVTASAEISTSNRQILFASPLLNILPDSRGGNEAAEKILANIQKNPCTIQDLVTPEADPALVILAVSWLAKAGLVQIQEPASRTNPDS